MRNLVTVLRAAASQTLVPTETIDCTFRVLPWDVGVRTLKSDRYFAIAEAAQLDFLTRTGLLWPLLKNRVGWVNLAQSSVFRRPLNLFQSFDVATKIMCADDKHAYFVHTFSSSSGEHAEVLVKAKFKRGSVTVPPEKILGPQPSDKSESAKALDSLTCGSGNAGLMTALGRKQPSI